MTEAKNAKDALTVVLTNSMKKKEEKVKELNAQIEADKLLIKTMKKGGESRPFYRTWLGRGVGHTLRFLSSPFARLNEEATLRLDFPDEVAALVLVDNYSKLCKKTTKVKKPEKMLGLIKSLMKLQMEMEHIRDNGVLQPESYQELSRCVENCRDNIRNLREQSGYKPTTDLIKLPAPCKSKESDFLNFLVDKSNDERKEDGSNDEHRPCSCNSNDCGSDNHLQQASEEDQKFSD